MDPCLPGTDELPGTLRCRLLVIAVVRAHKEVHGVAGGAGLEGSP